MSELFNSQSENRFRTIYGPVPSHRLGRSLGVDIVPFKTCSYDCIYCQLGRTNNKTIDRMEYVSINDVLDELVVKLRRINPPDYISIAGSGEPTLNSGIGDLILNIKRKSKIPIVVFTNSSLLHIKEVRSALQFADIVIPSLDVGNEQLFSCVNRPYPIVGFQQMVEGLIDFADCFEGEVWLEVMLVQGITGFQKEVSEIAAIAEQINPDRIHLNTVFRPPAEDYASPQSEKQMQDFSVLFKRDVSIVSEDNKGQNCFDGSISVTEEDVLKMIERRPCSSRDIAHGLGIHHTESIKYLEKLRNSGKILHRLKDRTIFYHAINHSKLN
ncbi:radical SAM protein [bacterium]|nr:radical SAM protein [bacterium]